MADAVAHGKLVLSAVVGGAGSVKALDWARNDGLVPEHFTDTVQEKLYRMLTGYADEFGGIMPRAAVPDALRGYPPGTVLRYGEYYDALAATLPQLHEFKHSVAQLRDLAAERATVEAMATGERIIRDAEGVRLDDGRELRGHADARAYVLERFADAEHAAGAADSPEGDVRAEGDDILDAYVRAREMDREGKAPGVQFGLPALDASLGGGLCNGEMALLLAGISAGKSSLCVQTAWHNAVEQGRNVLIFTTEQLRTAVRVKLVARHSRHPKFGLERGLNSAAIRSGRLSEEEERQLARVLSDLKASPGMLQVVQMPQTTTLSVMAARAAAVARQCPPDLVIIDALQLFSPDRARRESREHEDLSGILITAKRWAASFLDGRGVPLISPWQLNREGRKGMRQNGLLTLEDLASTDEAGRSPDMVLALANPEEDDTRGRAARLSLKVLKMRDGARGERFEIIADYATSCFTDAGGTGPGDYLDLDL